MADDHDVVLSRHERQVLAQLERSAAALDPDLDRRLGARLRVRWPFRAVVGSVRLLAGITAIGLLGGTLLVSLTIFGWLWVAVVGCGLLAVGLWAGSQLVGRAWTRFTTRVPTAGGD